MTSPSLSGRPLGAFERAMLRTQRHSPFDVVLVLRFARGPSGEAVERALAALQARHALLRWRIGGPRRAPAFVEGAPAIPLERVERQGADGWRALAERQLAHRFDLESGPFCHALLAGPDADGHAELVLTLPHFAVDGSSGAPLLEELLAAAEGAEDGGEVSGGAGDADVPDATGHACRVDLAGDLPHLEDRFPARFRGFGGRLRVLRGLARELAGEARYAFGARGLPPLRVARTGGSRIATFELEAPETAALLAGLRRRRLTLNAALVGAWSAAFAAARYGARGGPVRVFTMASLRRLVSPPVAEGALGSGWAMTRVTLPVPQALARPGDDSAAAAATTAVFTEEVRDALRAGFERGDPFVSFLTAESMMGLVLGPVKKRMGELAVSYTGVAKVGPAHGALRLDGFEVFVSTMDIGPALIAQHRIWRGQLFGGLVYHEQDLDAPAVAALAEDVRLRLATLAAPRPEPAPPTRPRPVASNPVGGTA